MPLDVLVRDDGEFPFCAEIECGTNPFSVWSSCAVTNGGSVVCPAAGGHQDRAGNEVYLYDIPMNMWFRVRDPDPLDSTLLRLDGSNSGCPGPSRDGIRTPGANHHYGGVVYNPFLEELLLLSSGAYSENCTPFQKAMTWVMNLGTFESRQQPFPLSSNTTMAALDHTSGILYIADETMSWYDATDPSYPLLGSFGHGDFSSFGVAVVAPGQGLLVPRGGTNTQWVIFPFTSSGGLGARRPLPGLSLADCRRIIGEKCPAAGAVAWNNGLIIHQGGRVLRWTTDGVLRDVTPSNRGPARWSTFGITEPSGDDQRLYGKFFQFRGKLYVINNPLEGVWNLVPEGGVSPPTPGPPVEPGSAQSFAERCEAPGVVLCDPLDTEGPWDGQGNFLPNEDGQPGAIRHSWWENWRGLEVRSGPPAMVDGGTRASGTGSLRFTISQGGASASGDWATNLHPSLRPTFGPGDTFWVQWRFRADCEFLFLDCDPGDPRYQTRRRPQRPAPAHKMAIIGAVDPRPGESSGSCSPIEIVISMERGFVLFGYHACGWYDGFDRTVGGRIMKQFGGDYDCRYRPVDGGPTWSRDNVGPDCFQLRADEWHTIMVRVELAEPQGRNDRNPRSRITIFGGYEGEPVRPVIDTTFNFRGGQRYGKVWFLPYLTKKDPSDRHAVGHIWYDELIVSTERIADPS